MDTGQFDSLRRYGLPGDYPETCRLGADQLPYLPLLRDGG